jgi:hypothetical protein
MTITPARRYGTLAEASIGSRNRSAVEAGL